VGRKRKDDSLGLPERVYVRRGSFYYVHRDTGRWEPLGKDLAAARKRAEHYNDPKGAYGTMTWFFDQFLVDCGQRVRAGKLSARTLADYTAYARPLKAYFGAMLPTEVEPNHVNAYLEMGVEHGRSVVANREKACLSSCFSWMLRSPIHNAGLQVNPCMRRSGIVRNPEKARDRYVTHAEYRATYDAAPPAVRLMMELVYRTLQRPEVDVLAWTPANIRSKGAERVLHFRQSKTGRLVDIALTGRLGELVAAAVGAVPVLHQPILHTTRTSKRVQAGSRYTYDGISAMLKRAQRKAKVASFGFRDLKGKGATDMWLAGMPIERIQLLCGHADAKTTEIYIKARWTETAQPNAIEIA
jgi:integrase